MPWCPDFVGLVQKLVARSVVDRGFTVVISRAQSGKIRKAYGIVRKAAIWKNKKDMEI
jgi:hypothetical protein